MSRDAVAELVSQAAELERRDEAIAQQLDVVADLADRASGLRERGAEISSALERLPAEREEAARLRDDAAADADAAREQLRLAEERLGQLERSRRRRTDQLERARKEALTARELLADAVSRVERLHARDEELDLQERSLREESLELARAASGIAAELERLPQVGDDAAREPGATLAELEEWGFLVRSTLFVARGTLEAERERVVAEANALGAAALGEDLGGASVALVRRRLEAELARS